MSRALQHWVAAELMSTGAFTSDEARMASRAFANDRQLDDVAAGVALARATSSLPQGREWWISERKEKLISGHPMKAYRQLSEDLSDPPTVVIDEWPQPGEPLKARIPQELSPGDTFLVGDMDGRRATATIVVESDGLKGARCDPPDTDAALNSYHHAALMEAITRLQRGL